MKLNFDIDDTKLKRELEAKAKAIPNDVKAVVADSAQQIESQAQSLAPIGSYPDSDKKGGNLKASITATYFNKGFSAEIGTPVFYAPYVEHGTKPHKIKSKSGGNLTFKLGGNWISKRVINHPGTAPQPFLFPAFESEQPKYLKALRKAVSKS